jgi:phenylacetic acid degradation operon negative regulatory protein
MPTDRFIDLTEGLRDLGGGRVWSLMISLFGDLAQEEGQSVDGPVLSAIMQGLRIKPEAARVALHRLRNDGWITSRKSGRISQHMLSAKGRAESAAASPRIYADPDQPQQAWQLVVTSGTEQDESESMAVAGFAQIMARIYVGPAAAGVPGDAIRLPGGDLPDWLRLQAQPETLRQGYADLLTRLEYLDQALPAQNDLSPVEIAVLRCLIVHNWRRLILKHPTLPAPLVDPDWPGHRCHLLVHRFLTHYPRPGLDAIEQARAAA